MTAVSPENVREAAKYLVAQEEYQRGSRMLAYREVGRKVGASSMWVRRFVKGYEGAGLNFIVGGKILALREAYENLCSRVEKEIEQERATIAALRGPIDAVDLSALDLVEDSAREKALGTE